jgi:tRNA threonylcarbamoyl adenosine modification protein (Sua5/YciO/YrdC/YwlC family)
MTEIIRIDTERPDERGLKKVVEVLKRGGLIIYPTDSVYTMGCDIFNQKAFLKLCQLKGVEASKAQFPIVCSDLSHLSDFAKQFDTSTFRIIKKHLPGPFTFILESNKNIKQIFYKEKKTIGIRVPDVPLTKRLIENFGQPIFSASVQRNDHSPYAASAQELFDLYEGEVDLVIDGGACGEVPTTIVDLSNGFPEVIRHGKGIFLN